MEVTYQVTLLTFDATDRATERLVPVAIVMCVDSLHSPMWYITPITSTNLTVAQDSGYMLAHSGHLVSRQMTSRSDNQLYFWRPAVHTVVIR